MKLALFICVAGGLLLAPLATAVTVPKGDDCASACCKAEGTCCESECPCPIACIVPATGAAVLTARAATPQRPALPVLLALPSDFCATSRADCPPVPPPRA